MGIYKVRDNISHNATGKIIASGSYSDIIDFLEENIDGNSTESSQEMNATHALSPESEHIFQPGLENVMRKRKRKVLQRSPSTRVTLPVLKRRKQHKHIQKSKQTSTSKFRSGKVSSHEMLNNTVRTEATILSETTNRMDNRHSLGDSFTRIFPLIDVVIKGINRLSNELSHVKGWLKNIETKQDNILYLLNETRIQLPRSNEQEEIVNDRTIQDDTDMVHSRSDQQEECSYEITVRNEKIIQLPRSSHQRSSPYEVTVKNENDIHLSHSNLQEEGEISYDISINDENETHHLSDRHREISYDITARNENDSNGHSLSSQQREISYTITINDENNKQHLQEAVLYDITPRNDNDRPSSMSCQQREMRINKEKSKHSKSDQKEKRLDSTRTKGKKDMYISQGNQEEDISCGVTLNLSRLEMIKEKALTGGNFAALLVKELLPRLYGPDQLRHQYSWKGGGVLGKKPLNGNIKELIRKYVCQFYPECQNKEVFQRVVINSVNEGLRRPSQKSCRKKGILT